MRTLIMFLALAATVAAGPAAAQPKSELWDRWTPHDESSTLVVDHTPWDRFLDRYVSTDANGVNLVDYGTVTAEDLKALQAYQSSLSAVPVSRLNRNAQRALWINLYNALTVSVILDHYPVDTIMDIDISPGLFANGPWGRKLIAVDGTDVSLDDIEHRILRPIWKDPRVHYAVNCASLGCPNLQKKAFTAAAADAMLTAAAVEFVNDPRGVRFEGNDLIVSKIYDWFEEDFGGSEAGVLDHVRTYANPDLAARLKGLSDYDDAGYNWRLNNPRPSN